MMTATQIKYTQNCSVGTAD